MTRWEPGARRDRVRLQLSGLALLDFGALLLRAPDLDVHIPPLGLVGVVLGRGGFAAMGVSLKRYGLGLPPRS